MPKARSPQYPAIGLKEAIEKARAVYESDYQNSIPRALVASHMGYQGLNGKSLGVLAALTRFGLIEGRGDDTRITDLAVTIIAHQPGTPERARALAEAGSKPELFQELAAKFPGRASDQALRSFLMTQKFIPSAADAAIRAYRETMGLVDAETAMARNTAEDGQDEHFGDGPDPSAPPKTPQAPAANAPTPLPEGDPYRVAFSPTGGLEIVAKLKTLKDTEALISSLNIWKTLFMPIE